MDNADPTVEEMEILRRNQKQQQQRERSPSVRPKTSKPYKRENVGKIPSVDEHMVISHFLHL